MFRFGGDTATSICGWGKGGWSFPSPPRGLFVSLPKERPRTGLQPRAPSPPLLLQRKPALREPLSYVVVVFFLELPGESWGTPHKLDLNAGQGAPSLAGMTMWGSFSIPCYLGNGLEGILVPHFFERNSNLSRRLPCLDTNSCKEAIDQASQVLPGDETCLP